METYTITKEQFIKSKTNFYQNVVWFEIVKNGLDIDYKILETHDSNKVVCQTPVFIMKKGIFRFIGSPLRGTFTPHLGPVWHGDFNNDYKHKVLTSILTEVRKLKPHYLEFCVNDNALTDFELTNSWMDKKAETFILKLEGEADDIWKKFDKRGRNMVRKAEKNDVGIEEIHYSESSVDEYYKMLSDTFRRRKSKMHHSKKFFNELVKILDQTNQLIFVKAVKDGKTASMGIFVHNDYEIHFLSGTSDPDFNFCAPNNLMHWYVIQKAIRMNLKKYDMGGKGIPSIDKFKASFGADSYSFTKRIWVSSLLKIPYKLLAK